MAHAFVTPGAACRVLVGSLKSMLATYLDGSSHAVKLNSEALYIVSTFAWMFARVGYLDFDLVIGSSLMSD